MASQSNKGKDSLQSFVERVNGTSHLRVEHDFGDGFVRLRSSEADRRQAAQDIQCSEDIVLELLRNARDAHAAHIFMAVAREGDHRSITIIDDGDGIPASMHEHVFEPHVTSKLDTSHMDAWGLHGRGMALYSIRENALQAKVVDSSPGKGCSISVRTDLKRLGEKADQSSFPRFELGDDGQVNVRGPRNILRTACEFSIEARNDCTVHVGSPAEIAAALYSYGNTVLSAVDRVFCKDASDLPLTKRPATASDPDDLAAIAAAMGIDISSRTARRIIDGQIQEAPAMIERISIDSARQPEGKRRKQLQARARRLHVQKDDSKALASAVLRGFGDFADRYYLESEVDPVVKVMRDRIVISIPIVHRE